MSLRLLRIIPVLILLLCAASAAFAEDTGLSKGPVKYALGASYGMNWSPHTDKIRFITTDASFIFDRDPFFSYKPASSLSWIIEGQAGTTVDGPNKLILSAGILVKLLFASFPDKADIYALGGIGGIYTDFKVEGQGLRINFNPQLGVGVDFLNKYYLQLRLHHVSNGGLNSDNTGINSAVIHSGVYF